MQVPLTILGKLDNDRREVTLWDATRLQAAELPEDALVEITSLRVFPSVGATITPAESYQIGLAISLAFGGIEEEIARIAIPAGRFQPIDILPWIVGAGKNFPIDSTSALKMRPVALGRGTLRFGIPDKITGYGSAIATIPENSQSLEADNRSAMVDGDGAEIALVNHKRISLTIANQGDSPCWLSKGEPGGLNRGIYLMPGGSAYHINAGNPWSGSIGAICRSEQSTQLSICEVSRR